MSETELAAGRELDALVAEKVMGWTVKPIRYLDGRGWHNEVGTGRTGMQATRLPDFSTDIAAAWLVVDRFAGERWYVCTEIDADGVWHADIGRHGRATAVTVPLAICRAALAAVGASFDGDFGESPTLSPTTDAGEAA